MNNNHIQIPNDTQNNHIQIPDDTQNNHIQIPNDTQNNHIQIPDDTQSLAARLHGIAQWVEGQTEKPGAILMRVRFPGTTRDFSPRVKLQCRLSYGVRTALVCCRMHQDLCARLESQTLAAILLLGHHKNTALTGRKA